MYTSDEVLGKKLSKTKPILKMTGSASQHYFCGLTAFILLIWLLK